MAEVAQNSPAEVQAKQVVYCGGKSHGPQSDANIISLLGPFPTIAKLNLAISSLHTSS
jgi:hypothetical protein